MMTEVQTDASRLAWDVDRLAGEEGERLLRFMRAMFFSRATAEEIDASVQQAGALGWVERHDDRPRLTPLGRTVADAAREYCNWLDDGRGLPVGLKPEDVCGRRVLDVGCGFGRHLLALQSKGADVIGVDLGEPYLRLSPLFAVREGQSTPARICAKGERLPFPEARFDLVLCIRSLSYMDLRATLDEAARVLVDGGRLIVVATPFSRVLLRCAMPVAWRQGVRGGLRQIRTVVNSVTYRWLGTRIVQSRRDRPTVSPVYVTERRLRVWMKRVGLVVRGPQPIKDVTVAHRMPRSE